MTTTENPTTAKPRRRWLRLGIGAVLTATLVIGGLGAVDAVAKPSKPDTFLPPSSTDTIRVQWKDTTSGATGYKVRYSKSSSMSGASTTACLTPKPDAGYSSYQWVQRLSAGTTYYFQVAAFSGTSCRTQLGGWSTRSDGRRTASNSYGRPGKPVVNNKGSNSLELSFVNVSGAGGYRIRYYSKSGGSKYVWSQVEDLTLTGLKRNTDYWIKAAVAERSTYLGEPQDCTVYGDIHCWPSFQQGPYSSEIKVRTSNYSVIAPTRVTISEQGPYQVKVSWTPGQTLPEGYGYRIQYSKSKTMSNAKYLRTRARTYGVLTGLSSNTNYYVRVYVVRTTSLGNLAAASDKSGFQIAKTLTPRGTITGRVTGPPPQDVQAMVYGTNGELVDQADLDSGGNYSLRVRPGTYKIKLAYIGAGDYTSVWVNRRYSDPARTNGTGTLLFGWAERVSIKRGATLNLGTTPMRVGATVTFHLQTSGAGAPITGADVAVIHGHNSAREVDTVQRTDSLGDTKLRGLAQPVNYTDPGKYWVRIVARGKKTASVWIQVKRNSSGVPVITRWGYSGGSSKTYTPGARIKVTLKNA